MLPLFKTKASVNIIGGGGACAPLRPPPPSVRHCREVLFTTESCNYFEKLLESNNCQPFDYNEYLSELPSTKQFFTAQLRAGQIFSAEIGKSILSEIEIPNFAEVCKHIPMPRLYTICSRSVQNKGANT